MNLYHTHFLGHYRGSRWKARKDGRRCAAAAKKRPEEALFAALRHTPPDCGLGTGRRRRSRHALKKKIIKIIVVQ